MKNQTAATVTSLYRSAQYGYQTAILYRQSLIPLANEDFEVALTAYQSGKEVPSWRWQQHWSAVTMLG